jgi:hypothetical protein
MVGVSRQGARDRRLRDNCRLEWLCSGYAPMNFA